MPQYGVLVYMPAPGDPMKIPPAYEEALERYPAQVEELGGRGVAGYALQPSTTATAVRGGVEVRPLFEPPAERAATAGPRPNAPWRTRTVASGPSCSPRRRASPATSTWPRSASRTPTSPRWRRGPVTASPASPAPGMLLVLMPDEAEVRGLLALLLLTDARRATRTDARGRLVLLENQDRAAWDRAAIDEGARLVQSAFADLLRRLDRPGEAADAYRAALELAGNEAERAFLAARLAEVTGL